MVFIKNCWARYATIAQFVSTEESTRRLRSAKCCMLKFMRTTAPCGKRKKKFMGQKKQTDVGRMILTGSCSDPVKLVKIERKRGVLMQRDNFFKKIFFVFNIDIELIGLFNCYSSATKTRRHKARSVATRLNRIKKVQQAKTETCGTSVLINQVWAREGI